MCKVDGVWACAVGSADAFVDTEQGATLDLDDGCNACVNAGGGEWECTSEECAFVREVGCVDYHNNHYETGESWTDPDDPVGFNICTCFGLQPEGISVGLDVSCRYFDPQATCVMDGREHANGESWTEDCNTCSCVSGVPICSHYECGETCSVESETYAVGEPVATADADADCECGDGGEVSCGTDAGGCLYGGALRAHGSIFPANDGINTCLCSAGSVACTDFDSASLCAQGETRDFGDGCNTCTCSDDGAWSCTDAPCEGACAFKGSVYPKDWFGDVDCAFCQCAVGKMICEPAPCAE